MELMTDDPIASVRERFLATDLYRGLALELALLESGTAETTMLLGPAHVNLDGSFHGGMGAFVADTTMGLAARTVLPAGATNRTLQLAIDFLARAAAAERIRCTARVANESGRFIWAACELTRESDGDLLGRATSLHLKPTRQP